MQSTLFVIVLWQQFIPRNYLKLPKTELFPADVLNKKCSFSLWPKGSLNYITTMHYLKSKSVAPEEILFLKLGNHARSSLSSCSLLTVIKRCMSACDNEREGKRECRSPDSCLTVYEVVG